MQGLLSSAAEPLGLAAALALALRVGDARRFPKNALLLLLALAAALAVRAAAAALLPAAPSLRATACAAVAAGLAHAFPGRGRWPAQAAAAALAAAAVLAPGADPLGARVAGAALGAAIALALLRPLESLHGLGAPHPLPPPRPRADPGAPLRVLFVAGEASADAYGARVLAALREREPSLVAFGIGGPRLLAAGLRAEPGATALAIVGFAGVLAALPRVLSLHRRLVSQLDRERPDAVICIDLPEFNAILALQARARGIPTLFYVAPQVWAWRAGRVAKLAGRISKLVVLFPFEVPIWGRAGVPVACHGHPLVELCAPRFASRSEACAAFALDPARPVLALAPGSRASELRHHLAPLLEAAARVQRARPELQLALALAPGVREDEVQRAARAAGVEIALARDAAFELFRIAELGLVCSGTATLEAALAGLPTLIFYRGHALEAALARRLVRVDRIGLPNLLLGGPAPLFPELFQEAFTADRLATESLALLADPTRLAALRDACARVRSALAGGTPSSTVADDILALAR